MAADFSALSYKQKVRLSEFIYLFILSFLSPLIFGFQLFGDYSRALSYMCLNITTIPVFILFYRVYLEKILFKRKWLLSVVLFPVYLLIYELYSRLCSYLMVHYFYFIPESYRIALGSGHPEKFDHFHQSFGYTLLNLLTVSALSVIRVFFLKEHELNTLRYAQVQLELENLRSQVQPHFFFNTLNNLYNLSLQASSKAPEMIASLSTIMRYVIYENQDQVPLKKEIDFMENYFELERIRHTDPGLIDFKVQGNPEGIQIAPLLFLPLIENCFKHALQRDVLENPVKIILLIDEEELVFQTSNKIIDEYTGSPHSGIGLSNVKKRLDLLYGSRYQMDILKESGDYMVTVSIRL